MKFLARMVTIGCLVTTPCAFAKTVGSWTLDVDENSKSAMVFQRFNDEHGVGYQCTDVDECRFFLRLKESGSGSGSRQAFLSYGRKDHFFLQNPLVCMRQDSSYVICMTDVLHKKSQLLKSLRWEAHTTIVVPKNHGPGVHRIETNFRKFLKASKKARKAVKKLRR